MSNIPELLTLAQQYQQAGSFAQAEQICRQVLEADATNVNAWTLLAAVQQVQGNLEGAKNAWQRVLTLRPGDADAHTKLGNVFIYQNLIDDGIFQYRQALRINPEIFAAHYILGIALHGQGRFDESETHYRHALRLNPNFAETHQRLGITLLDRHQFSEAEACFRRSLQLNPNLGDTWNNLGIALDRQNRPAEAVPCFQQAVRLKADCGQVYINYGLTLERIQQAEEALRCFEKALQLAPNDHAPRVHLGNFYKEQDRLDEAVQYYQQALQLAPNDYRTRVNLGYVYQEQGRFEEALQCFDQAMLGDGNDPGPHHNRALLWLLLGRWRQAWPEYEWRWRTKGFPKYDFVQPRWDGTPLEGRTILLLPEQGLGDTLQFIRYIPMVQQRGGRVVLACQPSMAPLLRASFAQTELVMQGSPFPQFDVYCPLLSLPGLFGSELNDVPAAIPYLRADGNLVERWRKELAPLQGFKIGIAWQGNPEFSRDRQRSIPLTRFEPLARNPGAQLISLQKGPGADQVAALGGRFPVLDLGNKLDQSGAFVDTAAVIINLDLVITSDTVVAHLAGALGVPVWVALSTVPDWRWLLQREDTPWYPGMRLFRQTQRGDWNGVFERMSQELHAKMSVTRNHA